MSPSGQELFREAAQVDLDPRTRLFEDLQTAALGGESMRPIAQDPVLAEGARRTTTANLLRWATANVQHPGERVAPALGPEAPPTARAPARRRCDHASLSS